MSGLKILSVLVASCLMLFIFVTMTVSFKPVNVHASPKGDVGRYQISSWAAYSGEKVHHSGYYIVDTTTGKVVDRGHEIHGITSGSNQ